MMTYLSAKLRHFFRSERAAVSVEAAIMTPVLIIFSVASYTYFDSYRRGATLEKATYAMSDVVSRQDDLSPAFIQGMQNVFEFMTGTNEELFIRVTQLRHQNGQIEVIWSYANEPGACLDQDSLQAHLDHIPTMQPNEHMIALETSATYFPAFNIGLPLRRAHNMVATPQRGGVPLQWSGPVPC